MNDVPGSKSTKAGVVLKVPALDRVFDSRDEFLAAYQERFGQVSPGLDSEPDPDCPPGYNSFEEFKVCVDALVAEGTTDKKAIAKMLEVPMKWVIKAS